MGIISATILSIPLGVTNFEILKGTVPGISWNIWENFGNFFSLNPETGGIFASMLKGGIMIPEGSIMTCIMLIISFAMVDTFDTMGTIVGCCQNAGLMTKEGKPIKYKDFKNISQLAARIDAIALTESYTSSLLGK